ncbi:MAG TPA: MFS transporter [Myxococcota bacterium]|nr:MFS transporter [Myxococcota bacterium]
MATAARNLETSGPAPYSDRYRRYVLGLLVVVYVFNFIDRQILTILGEDIRKEIGFSDTIFGLLTGPAFAILYTFVGIPIGFWADTGTRRSIVALALFFWSLMTTLTGFVGNLGQLIVTRIGVGIGEAGGSPPSHSILSDIFPPDRRATALATYSLGIPIGGGLGLLLGGWFAHFFGWRMAFVIVGIPGLVLALLVRFTVREPVRGGSDPTRTANDPPESLVAVMRFLRKLPSFVHMSIGASLHALYGYAAAAFVPVFLIRVHHMERAEVGTWLGTITITVGVLGTFLGGAISDRIAARDPRWYMRVPAVASAIGIPFAFLFYLWPDPRTAILLSIPGSLIGGVYLGPTFAMTQSLVRPNMRALASAILLFIINLIGLGLGPLLVGILSDKLRPTYGDESVRYALLWVVVIGASWATLQYLLAGRTLARDLQAKHA